MYNRVIVDTSAIYALISASDNFHQQSLRIYKGLVDTKTELYATSYILVETSALVNRRLGFQQLKTFMESIQNIFNIYWIDRTNHTEAWKLMVVKDGKKLSFVDCTTVLVCKKLNASLFAFGEDLMKEAIIVIPK